MRTNFYEKTEFDMKMFLTKIDRNRTKIWSISGPPVITDIGFVILVELLINCYHLLIVWLFKLLSEIINRIKKFIFFLMVFISLLINNKNINNFKNKKILKVMYYLLLRSFRL